MKNENGATQYEKYLNKWADGVFYELDFWSKWVESQGLRWPEDFTKRMNPNSEVKEDMKELILSFKRKDLKILDVGAGPISYLGYKIPNMDLSIEACDPLASFYSKILEKNKLTPPVTTNFAMAEKLSEVYPANTFDFIWCNNALDHSFDPVYAISEMIHVAKIGGTVVLSHNENEAVNENYDGFHQWNFTERNNEFIIWNKDFDINVTKLLEPGTKVVIERKGDTKTWIMVRITKTEGKVDQAIFPKQIINHGLINYCTKLILDTKPVLF